MSCKFGERYDYCTTNFSKRYGYVQAAAAGEARLTGMGRWRTRIANTPAAIPTVSLTLAVFCLPIPYKKPPI
ncbi:MAG: hypothetical protein DWQ04_00760 [Chloroflexi bacterium]|nr:MAG: hypothetical protein DWQ04_00760 [Chloroflexota bacterium]